MLQRLDEDLFIWLEKHIWMIPLYPRHQGYDVLANTHITAEVAQKLAEATEKCWSAILEKNAVETGCAMTESLEAQIAMFPEMVNPDILAQIEQFKPNVLGWKVSGAGGGGYLIFFSEKPIRNAIQIRVRRS